MTSDQAPHRSGTPVTPFPASGPPAARSPFWSSVIGRWLFLPIFAAGWVWTAPARAQSPAPAPTPLSAVTAPVTLQRTELYFGGIARTSWDEFLAQVVTPRFPDGLTWYDTHGQWQTRLGEVTRQDSRVLVLLHAATPDKDRLVEELREEFKTRYHEISVLRADVAVTASF